MKRLSLIALLCVWCYVLVAQVTMIPAILQQGYTGEVKIIFNPNEGNQGMVGASECYLYSCADIGKGWEYELEKWPSKSDKTKMTKVGSNWEIVIPNLYTFYGIPSDKTIQKLLVLFTDGTNGGQTGRGVGGADIEINLVEAGFAVALRANRSDMASQGDEITLVGTATEEAELILTHNGAVVNTEVGTSLTYTTTLTEQGTNIFGFTAKKDEKSKFVQVKLYVAATPVEQARPEGVVNGIYPGPDGTSVTLCTYAASKTEPAKHVFLVGDMNNWTLNNQYQLKRDGNYFWITLTGLQKGKEYCYQYAIERSDGVKKQISDLFSEKVLSQVDKYEPKTVDPTLIPYPSSGADGGYVSVLQLGKEEYKWSDATLNFKRPDKNNLVIYEMWVYDHTPSRCLEGLKERMDYLQNLGVNAIELMPVNEFDDNNSWGYSPNHYFALDKAYGTPEMLKDFVDECHKRGMAVILDMVFNHATGNNPMNKLYPWTSEDPTKTDLRFNPWFNVQAPHDDNVYEDWNHGFEPTRDHFTRVLKYWLTEYKIDGYRMDLSHGLCSDLPNTSVENLKYYYKNGVKDVSPDAYFILEHWGKNTSTEWDQLIAEGMMCWANTAHAFQQTAMGWLSDGDDLSWANKDNFVSYCENHDEERCFFKAKKWGNGSDLKNKEEVRAARVPMNLGFQCMLNGPQLFYHFAELGFDMSKFQDRYGRWGDDDDRDYDHGSKYGVKPQIQGGAKMQVKLRPENYGWFKAGPRMDAYQRVAKIIQLRTRLLPTIFEGDPTDQVIGATNVIRYVQWGSDVYAVANFSSSATKTVELPAGTWYDYLDGNGKATASYSLKPGEIKVFTGTQLTVPNIPNHYDIQESVGQVEWNSTATEPLQTKKFYRDGNIYILREGKTYDLMGRRVQ